MSGPSALRKGWCPGALRPMMARDGLLVRLRISAGIVTPEAGGALADLAEAHGNGLFDLSSRANLQMRGVDETALPPLLDGLRGLGLLDANAGSEAVRNVLASPLAGLGGGLDIRPLVTALEARLTGDASLHRLPSKFGFLIDDGGAPTLADVPADVRFDWIAATSAFAVGLGGTRYDAAFAGFCSVDGLVEHAVAMARATIDSQGDQPRRMRALLRDLSPTERANRFGVRADNMRTSEERHLLGDVVGIQSLGFLSSLGLGLPFGRLDAAMLREAAAIADACRGTLRLTPWRAILVPCLGGEDASSRATRGTIVDMSRRAARSGFIVDPSDPRLRVAACVGMMGCERGTTTTHEDATVLADLAATFGNGPTPLHVSGCEKGCAKPSSSTVTLVGRDGRYDLVRNGRPGDTPTVSGLDLDEIRTALSAMGLQPA